MFLLVVAAAWACKWVAPGLTDTSPADGAVGVPVDAAILLIGAPVEEVEVRDAEGLPVDVEREDGREGSYDVVWLRPVEAFPAGMTLTVETSDRAVMFTTGDSRAEAISEPPAVALADIVMGDGGRDSCPPTQQVSLDLAPGDGERPASWEIEVDDVGLGEGLVHAVADEVEIGSRHLGYANYDLEPERVLQIRARGVNAAGSPGPWSEPIEVRTPCACAPTGGSAPLLVVGGALAAVLRRRDDNVRRRSRGGAAGEAAWS